MNDFLIRLATDAELQSWCSQFGNPNWVKEYEQLKVNPEVLVSDDDMSYYYNNWTIEQFIEAISSYDSSKYRRLISSAIYEIADFFELSGDDVVQIYNSVVQKG